MVSIRVLNQHFKTCYLQNLFNPSIAFEFYPRCLILEVFNSADRLSFVKTFELNCFLLYRFLHAHFGLDWSVGQDFLVACWIARDQLLQKHIMITDLGPEYNYCPPTDTMKHKAFEMAWEALDKRSVTTLHLKSKLKSMLYDERFPNAVLNYPKGELAWL